MNLSVCLMVRNEEKNLPRALDSVREVADEILIVDTGSVDNTIAIARSYGSRILNYTWHEDFSAPHNFGWDHARGDWLLWLDADESLLASSIPQLKQCLARTDVGGFYVQRQEILDSSDPTRYSEMFMLRLHRRDLPARWVGRYHNQIIVPPPDAPPQDRWIAARSNIKLQHWRHKEDPLLRARRAGKILAEELEAEPDNLYVKIELANCLQDLKDPRAAQLRLQVARALKPDAPRAPTVPVVYILDYLIAYPDQAAAANFSFADVRSMCKRWFPRSAPLKWGIAQRLFSEQDYEGAGHELTSLIYLLETDELDKLVPFDPRIKEDAEFNLAVCLTRLTFLDEAEKLFKRFLDHPTRALAARANLEMIAQLRLLEDD